jgi:hypothetical protein
VHCVGNWIETILGNSVTMTNLDLRNGWELTSRYAFRVDLYIILKFSVCVSYDDFHTRKLVGS